MRLDEVSGNIAYDAKGVHHGNLMDTMTFSGCTTTGVLGSGLVFDGQRNRIQATSTAAIVPSGNLMTIMAWVKPYSLGSQLTVMRKNLSFDMRVQANAKLYVKTYNQDGVDSGSGNVSSDTLAENTWYHLSAVVSNDTVSSYINGTFQRSDPIHTTSIGYNGGQQLYIGDADADDNTVNNMNGVIDDVRIYDRAYTEAELKIMAELYR